MPPAKYQKDDDDDGGDGDDDGNFNHAPFQHLLSPIAWRCCHSNIWIMFTPASPSFELMFLQTTLSLIVKQSSLLPEPTHWWRGVVVSVVGLINRVNQHWA